MSSVSILIALLTAVLGCQPAAAQDDTKSQPVPAQATPRSDTRYLGLGFSTVDYADGFGLRIDSVYPGSPADEAGVEVGDILIGLEGEAVSSLPRETAIASVTARIRDAPASRALALKLARGEQTFELQATPRPIAPGSGPTALKADRAMHPEWEGAAPGEEERAADRLVAHYRIGEDYRDLRSRLKGLSASADAFRIQEVAFVQRNPFLIREAADGILMRIRPRRDSVATATGFLNEAERLLSGSFPQAAAAARLPPLKTGISVTEHLAQLKALLAEADAAWTETYGRLTPEELETLFRGADALARKFEDLDYIHTDRDRERRQQNLRTLALAAKLDYSALIRSAVSLIRIGNLKFLEGFRRDLERAGLDLSGAEVLSEKTAYGEILIGGTGDNRYTNLEERGVAILIDLGGNDFYADRVAAATRKIHASIVVDVAGDDAYESNVDYSQGSGFMGIGILIDTAGNDSYIGTRMSQGASLLGVGLLLDEKGRDLYRAHAYSQGSAFWGAAALIDQAGDDRYEARLLSQAVGIAGGIAALIDRSGDDSYYAKGAIPSGYGTPGTFGGWSQGVGVGLRDHASGGVGILYDGGGSNRMESGDFCQGGGYYFGWGILRGGKGNDTYIGSRYAQGFAAHYALGTFIDEGGDDRYETRNAVAAGLAWDLSIAWFEDRGGNDRYPAQAFSLGASAHNSIAVFIDRGGNDRMVGTLAQANGQTNEYRGGTSLSLVLNLGRKTRRLDFRDRHTFILNAGRSIEQTLDRLLGK